MAARLRRATCRAGRRRGAAAGLHPLDDHRRSSSSPQPAKADDPRGTSSAIGGGGRLLAGPPGRGARGGPGRGAGQRQAGLPVERAAARGRTGGRSRAHALGRRADRRGGRGPNRDRVAPRWPTMIPRARLKSDSRNLYCMVQVARGVATVAGSVRAGSARAAAVADRRGTPPRGEIEGRGTGQGAMTDAAGSASAGRFGVGPMRSETRAHRVAVGSPDPEAGG